MARDGLARLKVTSVVEMAMGSERYIVIGSLPMDEVMNIAEPIIAREVTKG